jgi:hypothetical protein
MFYVKIFSGANIKKNRVDIKSWSVIKYKQNNDLFKIINQCHQIMTFKSDKMFFILRPFIKVNINNYLMKFFFIN